METEEELAEVLEDLLHRYHRGESVDLETVLRQYPQREADLRELWATMMIAEEFGSFTADDLQTLAEIAPLVDISPEEDEPQQFGDYELLEVLGRGGMGIVYKARQKSLGRIVALKMILTGQLASETDIRRFEEEARSTARLNHPNIVSVYDVGECEGKPYFTMEYIEGRTLAQRLADGPLTSREAARLMVPICHAIAEAHAKGILHRDLKASNILLDAAGIPYVTDFGLAKRIPTQTAGQTTVIADGHSLTQSGAILGTPGYMAPEQAAGRRGEVTQMTDVYSLGALLYAMLTGRPPFQAPSPVDTVLMVLEQDPLPPRLLNQKVDADLEMVVLKCLQKPTDLRYKSALELAADLEAFLRNEPVSARSSHFTQILSRAFRETHHAGVLENWGLLWMWHSLVLIGLCFSTNIFQYYEITNRWPYLGLWVLGLGVWAFIFWNLRRRSGPITFVERQIAHIWAASMCASTLLFLVEILLGLPVLMLSPILGLVSGMVFLVKAGILSGAFYLQSMALFATAAVMAVLQKSEGFDWGISLFGIVSAICFFVPGLKYYRQRKEANPH